MRGQGSRALRHSRSERLNPNIEGTLKARHRARAIVHAALGIHPTEFFNQNLEAALDIIKTNASECVAVGEIGLRLLAQAGPKGRGAEGETEGVLRQPAPDSRVSSISPSPYTVGEHGVTASSSHQITARGEASSTGTAAPSTCLKEVLDAGYYVSCTPAVEVSAELRAAMMRAPLERILVETDSPVWIKSLNRPSEPTDVLLTFRHLSELKGLPRRRSRKG